MRIRLTIKNYRCFSDRHPVVIEIRAGFVAVLGLNNSGKSTLLRFFHEFRGLFNGLKEQSILNNAVRGLATPFSYFSVPDPAEVFHDQNDRSIWLTLEVEAPEIAPAQTPPAQALDIEIARNTNAWQIVTVTPPNGAGVKPDSGLSISNGHLMRNNTAVADLRGYLKAAALLTNTLYIGAFRNILNTGTDQSYFDIQVGEAFVTRWRNMQTGDGKVENAIVNDVVQVIERVFGYTRLEIVAAASGKTLQVVINHRPYKLTELGAGIAQFAIVLANAAIRRPDFILIDEPELNLHPSLQIDFLATLASYASIGTIFATHSIGLARAMADRIYSVRIKDGVSEVCPYEATKQLSEFLGSLSYSSYRELGFDRVLLVEGVTEVQTFHQFLRLVRKDHQIIILPLGGSAMISGRSGPALEEIKRITPNVLALIDSERVAAGAPLSGDREAFRATCDAANIQCKVLDRRATENYLGAAAIQRIKGPKYRALGPFEKLENAPLGWSKSENWRIAREMTLDDLTGTDLRNFLEAL